MVVEELPSVMEDVVEIFYNQDHTYSTQSHHYRQHEDQNLMIETKDKPAACSSDRAEPDSIHEDEFNTGNRDMHVDHSYEHPCWNQHCINKIERLNG